MMRCAAWSPPRPCTSVQRMETTFFHGSVPFCISSLEELLPGFFRISPIATLEAIMAEARGLYGGGYSGFRTFRLRDAKL